jgi:hypothetical protein
MPLQGSKFALSLLLHESWIVLSLLSFALSYQSLNDGDVFPEENPSQKKEVRLKVHAAVISRWKICLSILRREVRLKVYAAETSSCEREVLRGWRKVEIVELLGLLYDRHGLIFDVVTICCERVRFYIFPPQLIIKRFYKGQVELNHHGFLKRHLFAAYTNSSVDILSF